MEEPRELTFPDTYGVVFPSNAQDGDAFRVDLNDQTSVLFVYNDHQWVPSHVWTGGINARQRWNIQNDL